MTIAANVGAMTRTIVDARATAMMTEAASAVGTATMIAALPAIVTKTAANAGAAAGAGSSMSGVTILKPSDAQSGAAETLIGP